MIHRAIRPARETGEADAAPRATRNRPGRRSSCRLVHRLQKSHFILEFSETALHPSDFCPSSRRSWRRTRGSNRTSRMPAVRARLACRHHHHQERSQGARRRAGQKLRVCATAPSVRTSSLAMISRTTVRGVTGPAQETGEVVLQGAHEDRSARHRLYHRRHHPPL